MPDILELFQGVQQSGDHWVARCPAHDDRHASLSIGRGDDGRWLLKCHAGCDIDAILRAVNLDPHDLFPSNGYGKRQIECTYNYTDPHGELVFQVVRFSPKDFRQRRPDGNNGWIWNTRGVQPLVYRRSEIHGREAVLVAEGEKDVDTLEGLGLAATCNAGGAGKWKSAHTKQLVAAGVKRVVVIPDADTPGRSHAEAVARSCAAAGLAVKIVSLPDGAKDVSAWREGGGTKAALADLIREAEVYTLTVGEHPVERPVVRTLSAVTPEKVRWVWPRRIAKGKLVIVAGEPGEGKSTLMLDVGARITRGAVWPDGSAAPIGSVLLLSAEDGLGDTIRPRLDACGADASRVHALTAARDVDGAERPFELGRDLPQLEHAIREYQPVLVVVDPLSAYLGRTDTWRDSEVRALLSPLASLADRHGCAIVGVLHLTKNASAKVLHRVMGSIGFVAAARVVLAVARDPDDDARRLFLPVKNNLSPPAETLAFTLNDGRLMWADRPVEGVTADSVLGETPADRGDRQDAEDFLRELLEDGEPMPATEVFRVAKANGISDRTLRRVKRRLHVRSKLVGFGRDGRWHWWLPVSAQPESDPLHEEEVAASVDKQTKSPMFSQRGPEAANPQEWPSLGHLCDAREGQEAATRHVAASVKTLIKHTEDEEAAKCEEREGDHADHDSAEF